MASLNKYQCIGNLGKDPEIRQAGDSQVANFSVAVTEKFKDREGNSQEHTEWVNVVCWRKLAEIAQQFLRKGAQVYVEGKLQTRKWQDKEGTDRYTTEIVADNFQMLGSKRENDGSEAPARGYGGQQQQGAGYGGSQQRNAQGAPAAGRYGGASGNPTDYQGGMHTPSGSFGGSEPPPDDSLPF